MTTRNRSVSTRSFSAQLSALLIAAGSIAAVPAALASDPAKTQDPATTESTDAAATAAADADAGKAAEAPAATPTAEVKPQNPCAPKAKKKPKNPCA